MADTPAPHRNVAWRMQALYVNALLHLLPLLISIFRRFSRSIASEVAYLKPGYTFQIRVDEANLLGTCVRKDSGSFAHVLRARLATDVEPGSGLPSANPDAATVDYVIAFRSLSYAFRCFSGACTLKDGLAERAFSTRGPNDTGVALTYMFSALLKMFFGWRAAYRKVVKPAARA